ncbi:ROK family protein [Nocardioides sp. ChNu-153]|uniref:polyphosphate--glucose phosphotransferase n=1 Tax=unclassified Nocardioides TaxID=2615069 RepID=UPI002406E594|nr:MULTISPECIES: ROK family protein [unclassified Nocardioides]MDF9716641.1 ROK family protein [Nocardioides sp. ChNu-99]MDN7123070.1 ROK family protein [Nocardioides sp. ChNu-153]
MDLPLGIDFGGSGIKAAPVDLDSGEFAAERVRIPTPEASTPANVTAVLEQLAESFPASDAPVGVTVPGIVRHGVIGSAANIDQSWIGTDAAAVFGDALGRPVHVLNDADAAGLAEVRYGAAKGHDGVVLVTTLGTGIGAAIVHDGVLVPNAELGHLWIDLGEGSDPRAVHAESWTANSAREREDLSWEEWAGRLTVFYRTLERLFSPDLFVVGGGVSKKADKFLSHVDVDTPLVPATLRNSAGIVGAALAASRA